jgi:hypothetical protein
MLHAQKACLSFCVEQCGGFEQCSKNADFAKERHLFWQTFETLTAPQHGVVFDRARTKIIFQVNAAKA